MYFQFGVGRVIRVSSSESMEEKATRNVVLDGGGDSKPTTTRSGAAAVLPSTSSPTQVPWLGSDEQEAPTEPSSTAPPVSNTTTSGNKSGGGGGGRVPLMGALHRLSSPLGKKKGRVPSPTKTKKSRRGGLQQYGLEETDANDDSTAQKAAPTKTNQFFHQVAHGTMDVAQAIATGAVGALSAAASAPVKLVSTTTTTKTTPRHSPAATGQGKIDEEDSESRPAPTFAVRKPSDVPTGVDSTTDVPSEVIQFDPSNDVAAREAPVPLPPPAAEPKEEEEEGGGSHDRWTAPTPPATVGPRAGVGAATATIASTVAGNAVLAVQAAVTAPVAIATPVAEAASAAWGAATRRAHPRTATTTAWTSPPPQQVLTPSPIVLRQQREGETDADAASGCDASQEAHANSAPLSSGLGILDRLARGSHEFWNHCFAASVPTPRSQVVAQLRQFRRHLQQSKARSRPNDQPGQALKDVQAAHQALNRILLYYITDETEPPTPTLLLDNAGATEQRAGTISHPRSLHQTATRAVQKIVEPMQRVLDCGAHPAKSSDPDPQSSSLPEGIAPVAPVPAPLSDTIIQSMTQVLHKVIAHTTIRRLFDSCISESTPFYGPWLESTGKNNVTVGQWEAGNDEGENAGDHESEPFPLQRTVTYELVRPSLMGKGDVTANVTQRQRCRWSDDGLVWDVRVDTRGVPFGETFYVKIRWVAVPASSGDGIQVRVGVSVVFAKQTIVSGKIRDSATSETGKLQLKLFQAVRQALGVADETTREAADLDMEAEIPPCGLLGCWFSTQHPVEEPDVELLRLTRCLESKLSAIEAFLPCSSDVGLNFTLLQLGLANQALRIVVA